MIRTKIISNNAITFFDEYHDFLDKKYIKDLKEKGQIWELSQKDPVFFSMHTNPFFPNSTPYYGQLVLYQNCIYGVEPSYSEEQIKLLVLEMADAERKKFERLKAKYNSPITDEIDYKRKPIPEDVRIAVWRRDQGKCVSCGSRENMEYDHIIPVSRGGNNTVRNIELLCEKCNRTKHDKIL
jgi:hypothetical protein